MEIIVITGKSGSGKSEFSRMLANHLNCPLIFMDEISHASLENTKTKALLNQRFGSLIFEHEKINRAALGKIIFNSPADLEFVNNLSWKFIDDTVDAKLKSLDSKFVILDYALLPKMKYFNLSRYKILILANKKTRFERLLNRDSVAPEYLQLREKHSLSYKRNEYDFVIDTSQLSLDMLDDTAKKIAKKIQI